MLTEIDEQFGLVTIDSIMEMVNTCRKEAGMKIVTEAEIDEAIDAKRDTIRQVFTEKLHALSDKEYMDFVSILARQYVANDDYDDGIIISDALDQYEIRMQTEIQKHTEAVEKHLSEDFRNLFLGHIPLGRMGLPEEIAEAIRLSGNAIADIG